MKMDSGEGDATRNCIPFIRNNGHGYSEICYVKVGRTRCQDEWQCATKKKIITSNPGPSKAQMSRWSGGRSKKTWVLKLEDSGTG
jgi:hypothetical protein